MSEPENAACKQNDALPDGNMLLSVVRAGASADHISSPARKKMFAQSYRRYRPGRCFSLSARKKEKTVSVILMYRLPGLS